MVKYIVISGIAASFLYLVSEVAIDTVGKMLQVKKQTGLSIYSQLKLLKTK